MEGLYCFSGFFDVYIKKEQKNVVICANMRQHFCVKSRKSRNTTIVERKDKNDNVIGYRVFYWDGDVRRNKSYKKNQKREADDFARDWDAEHMLPEDLIVGVDDRVALARLRKFSNIDDVLRFLEDNYNPNIKSLTLGVATQRFCEERERLGRRAVTMDNYRIFFKRISPWKDKLLSEIDEHLAREMLDQKYKVKRTTRKQVDKVIHRIPTYEERQYSPYNRLKFAKAMSAMYVWAIDNGWAKSNPFLRYTRSKITVDRKEIKFFTAAQTVKFMQNLDENLRPAFALMFYAGIRPFEILNEKEGSALSWNAIDFNKRQISIDATKTRKFRRFICDVPALWAELEKTPISQRKGNVAKATLAIITKARRRACAAAKLKWTPDIPRHSFASHAWFKLGPALTVRILGHEARFNVLEKYYLGIVSEKESEEYFKVGNIK